jgi:primary-amine oxidase
VLHRNCFPIALAALPAVFFGWRVGAAPTARVTAAATAPIGARQAPAPVAADRPPARHPLDPLDGEELALAAQLAHAHPEFPDGGLFVTIALQEPPKEEVLAHTLGAPVRREAFVVILDRPGNRTFEAVVDLRGRRVVTWRRVAGAQPLVLFEEYDRFTEIVKADPRWQTAMRRRGITDFEKVAVEAWAPGHLVPSALGGRRLLRGVCYLQDGASNYYGRPIEGVIPLVDMTAGRLVELLDTGIVPVPPITQNLDAESIGPHRADLRPLIPGQPRGPSFTVAGNEVRWQRWRFRLALHPREGLVLYTVGYEDQGRVRPILYRASLSETVVPYGDPDPAWAWRNAFDEGEYGIGTLASAVEKDAPPNAHFFDAVFADETGKPTTRPRRIALYERDGGVLWRHSDAEGRDDVRRARELVLLTAATIGNYDYLFHWIFRQDGSLEADVGATGIMLPKGVSDDALAHGSGHRVAPGVVAPHHQHFFCYRLDLDVDGAANSVIEVDTESAPAGPANPHGNVIRLSERVLKDERDARRRVSMERSRRWKIVNASRKTAMGEAPAYCLLPGENSLPYALPGSGVRRRAGFLDHHLWVTRYRPEERHAAGEYPNQSRGGEGLPRWSNGESVRDADLVVWYTMGLTHLPRPEEWPVMPVNHIGFKLVPSGFFTRNPALDVAP